METETGPRVLVYGVTGSGKTTLARRLGEALGVPWFEADQLTWLPNWKEVTLEDQQTAITAVCARDRWVLDTAYGKWRHIPLARATLIVALDYPRWVSLGRLIRRTARRVHSGEPCCNGNRETLRTALGHNGIIFWHFKSFRSKQRRIREMQGSDIPVVVIRSSRELEAFVDSINAQVPLPSANRHL